MHDTVPKTYRHLNSFQHECHLQVRAPRLKLPNGSVHLVEPDFAGRLTGFTLLFEALRAFPNHHRALMSEMRYGEKKATQKPAGLSYVVDSALRITSSR